MKKDNSHPLDPRELPRRAELRLQKSGLIPNSTTSQEDLQRLLHEFPVHQIELEMQNEQLQYAYDAIQQEHKRYSDLYDFAPVGYMTLDQDSTILETNLTASKMLGVERHLLKGGRLESYIDHKDLQTFKALMQSTFRSIKHHNADVQLFIDDVSSHPQRTLHLDAIMNDEDKKCLITFSEITDTKHAEQALKESEEQFRNMFEGHCAIMLIIDPASGFIIEANRAATRFYGWSIEELRTMRIEDIITRTPEQINFFLEHRLSYDKNKLHYRHRRADQSIRDVEVYSSSIIMSGKKMLYTVIHDITERLRHETATAFYISLLEVIDTMTIKQLLQMTLDKAEMLTDSSIGFFHYVDDDQKTLSLQQWSTNTLNMLCKAKGDAHQYNVDKAGVWADALRARKAVIHNNFASLPDRKGMPEGHAIVIREALVPIFRYNKVVAILGVGNKLSNYDEYDITWLTIIADAAWDVVSKKIGEEERKKQQAQQYIAEQLSMHDPLTGLPNRRLLSERVSLTLAQCRRNNTMAALMIFDLDKFKPVNDTLGHAIGDILLQEVATRSTQTLHRSGDSIARLGGDEFVVLLPQIDALSNAVIIAEKIRKKIKEPYIIEGHAIDISCSIGIAVFPDHGENELTLMKNADNAMYSAKQQGRDRVTVYDNQPIP